LTNQELVNLQKIEYHIYDIINTEITFEQRNKQIQELNLSSYEKLIYVPTFLVKNENEIKQYHTKFLEQGFEGTMIRNSSSLYKTKQRSSDLLKYKDFEDAEFKIIDYTIEKDTSGADENLVVWIVDVPSENGKITCKVRPKGSKQERKELYKKCVENFDQFKGRNLGVKYFEKTNDGNLRFPTTLRDTYTEYIRDIIM
jgi:ATP-dependent DNA ligase